MPGGNSALLRSLTGGLHFAPGALSEGTHAHRLEHSAGGAQLFTRVGAAALTA
jgi:hypothetical protein